MAAAHPLYVFSRVSPAPTAALLCLLAVGCNGTIGDAGSSPNGSGGTAGGGGANGGGGGGGGGSAGRGGPAAHDPGRVTLHRLNRVEYNNTVRDLLGTALRPADEFPSDDRGYGFDNIADVLSLSPLQVEMYQRAAERMIEDAMAAAGIPRARIVTCDIATGGDGCAETILRRFARRAFRRPVTDAEVKRLMDLVRLARMEGDTHEAGVRLGLEAILVSPHFVFRVEIDPDPTSLTPHPLSSHEVATRLSYFLWSSMPDDDLFAEADAGNLSGAQPLISQVARMLASPKADALVANFAGQWLYLRNLADHEPDNVFFPSYDDGLRDAMRTEAELMFREALFRGLPADKLLKADFTFVNDRLAKHYGLPAPGGTQHTRVLLPTGSGRGGLLTSGSILTVTSYPTRTSPVVRGHFVLEQLLCDPPPPPPPGVEGLKMEAMPSGSLRQRLEAHRKDPVCASCHSVMDPIGFGLEHYDGIGAYRTTDEGFPIDASGKLPDGRTFNGADELRSIVVEDPRFSRCLAEKVYTYALGRGPEPASEHLDPTTIDSLGESFAKSGFNLERLIESVVAADTFRKRRGEPENAGGAP